MSHRVSGSLDSNEADARHLQNHPAAVSSQNRPLPRFVPAGMGSRSRNSSEHVHNSSASLAMYQTHGTRASRGSNTEMVGIGELAAGSEPSEYLQGRSRMATEFALISEKLASI